MNIILGSKSPRRIQLLEGIFPNKIDILVSEKDEIYPKEMPVHEIPEYLSLQKAKHILAENDIKDATLITADTLVLFRNEVLSKPNNKQEAFEMLKSLSGNKHSVITGVTVVKNNQFKTFSEKTDVYFKELTEEEIEYYIDTYAPLDKAGSYGVQEFIGYIAVYKIEGCYYNIMGLPTSRLYQELNKLRLI